MVRLNLLLAALLVVCALGLVTSQDRARQLFGDVETAHAQASRLDVQWNQLQIEQTALAKASRIDTKARRELSMESISPERTLHLIVDPVDRVVRLGSPAPEVKSTPRAAPASRTRAGGAR